VEEVVVEVVEVVVVEVVGMVGVLFCLTLSSVFRENVAEPTCEADIKARQG
jgi:hypothetical protein